MMPLPVQTLTPELFAPFGDVIDGGLSAPLAINQGFALRHDDLTQVDVSSMDGLPKISVFVAQPRPEPIAITLMERHPLGSQSFYPLQDRPWLVVVCTDPQDAATFRVFRATGQQGVTYARNTWHHPLLVFDPDSRFLVVDRKGPGQNLFEVALDQRLHIVP